MFTDQIVLGIPLTSKYACSETEYLLHDIHPKITKTVPVNSNHLNVGKTLIQCLLMGKTTILENICKYDCAHLYVGDDNRDYPEHNIQDSSD